MKKMIFTLLVFMISVPNIYATKEEVVFSDCVDGDTIKVVINDEVKTVRLLAIDTPETVKPGTEVQPYGKEASDYTCDKITNAEKIELEYDPESDKTDKYDRILAWVYVDDSLLEKELLELGYARIKYIYGDYKYLDELRDVEQNAANNGLGIWSEEEYVPYEKEEKSSLWELILQTIVDYFEDALKDLLKKFKKTVSKTVEDIF